MTGSRAKGKEKGKDVEAEKREMKAKNKDMKQHKKENGRRRVKHGHEITRGSIDANILFCVLHLTVAMNLVFSIENKFLVLCVWTQT